MRLASAQNLHPDRKRDLGVPWHLHALPDAGTVQSIGIEPLQRAVAILQTCPNVLAAIVLWTLDYLKLGFIVLAARSGVIIPGGPAIADVR